MNTKYLKIMRGGRSWLLMGILSVSFSSCQKFLDKAPLDTLSQANFWETSPQLDMYIVGKYSLLPELDYYSDAVSDNMMGGGYAGGFSGYMNGQTVTPTAAGSGGWSWGAVYGLNLFFDNYQKCKDPFDSYKQTVGEASFLKALVYHNLVKQ